VSVNWDATPGYTALFQDVAFVNCSVAAHVVGDGLGSVSLMGGAVSIVALSPAIQVGFNSCIATGNSVSGSGSLPLGTYVVASGGAVSVLVNSTGVATAMSSSVQFSNFVGTGNIVAWNGASEGVYSCRAGWSWGGGDGEWEREQGNDACGVVNAPHPPLLCPPFVRAATGVGIGGAVSVGLVAVDIVGTSVLLSNTTLQSNAAHSRW
jgi:hypothetical protein